MPTIDARALDGEQRRIPQDLPADRTLVLLAFKQWQQRQVDAWIARAESEGWAPDLSAADSPARATIEVPCIGRRWSPARRFIDGGMAASIRAPAILARTWTAYTDVGRVQRALGIPDSDQVHALVVDRAGMVLARAAGDPTERSWPTIAAAMVN